jgi:EAL domain-containing protein (putative c-di-GMP-specific phosphodiesterase class I)
VVAVTAFAADIGASVIAEGVETLNELDSVKRLGVRAIQGFVFGPPASVHDWSSTGAGTLTASV